MDRLFEILTDQVHPAEQTICHKDLFNLAAAVRLHATFLDQCHDFVIILPFFLKTLGKRQRNQTLPIFSENKFYDFSDASRQFFISSAPLAEIFTTVHHRWQIAGHGKFRDAYFPVRKQHTCRPQQIRHSGDAAVWEGDIQRDQPSSGFPRIASFCPFLVFFQFVIPPLALLHIHQDRLQQAHSHHQNRIFPDDLLRKLQIVFPQFIVIAAGYIFSGICHQKAGDTFCIIIYFIHFQGFRKITLQFIVQTSVIIQAADLFRGAFFVQSLLHRPAHRVFTAPDPVFFSHFLKKVTGFYALRQHMFHMFVPGDHRREIYRELFYDRHIHKEIL